jgi:hypothetical protein
MQQLKLARTRSGLARVVALVFALALPLGLAGCQDDDDAMDEAEDAAEESVDAVEEAAEEAAEETEEAVEEVEEEVEDNG